MAAGDLDNDGDTDVVIAQTNGAPVILRNDGTKNHWIGIDLRGGKKRAERRRRKSYRNGRERQKTNFRCEQFRQLSGGE